MQVNFVLVAEIMCRNLGLQQRSWANSSQPAMQAEQLSPRHASAFCSMLDEHPVPNKLSQKPFVWSFCPSVPCIWLPVASHELTLSTGTACKKLSFGLMVRGGLSSLWEGCLVNKACYPRNCHRHSLSGSVPARPCNVLRYVLQAFSLQSVLEIASALFAASLRCHCWQLKTSRSRALQISLTCADHTPMLQEPGFSAGASLHSRVCREDAELSGGLPGCSWHICAPCTSGVGAKALMTVSSTLHCQEKPRNVQPLARSWEQCCHITKWHTLPRAACDTAVLESARPPFGREPCSSAKPITDSQHLFGVCWPRRPQHVAFAKAQRSLPGCSDAEAESFSCAVDLEENLFAVRKRCC